MVSQMMRVAAPHRTGSVAACLALICVTQLVGAGKSPMKVLKYDPTAEKMELFAAIDAKALSVRIVAHDAEGGNVFFENLSGKPLTVQLPEAVALTQVLKQVGSNSFFGPSGNTGTSGASNGTNGGQQGMAQSLGSGFGPQQGSNSGTSVGNNMNFGPTGPMSIGNGFFSIPPDRVAQVPFRAVCLNYGKSDPSPRMTYQAIPVETYSNDLVLQETLRIFGKGRLNQSVAQAAAWHLTDKLSWDDLAQIKKYTLPGVYSSQVPIFSKSQLRAAKELVAEAEKGAEKRKVRPENDSQEKAKPVVETASARGGK